MISCRTPEGFPSRCPLCQAEAAIDFSEHGGDAPCPSCGARILRSAQLLERLRAIARKYPELELDELTSDSPWPPGGDSLTGVEVMLELEQELGVSMSANIADRIDTVGDAIRYFERQLGEIERQ